MKPVWLALLVAASLSAAPRNAAEAFRQVQDTQTFTGIITDDMCPLGDHGRMRMGPTAAECVKACIDAHRAAYVLYDGKSAYVLTGQQTPERFAAQKVRVVGTLDEKTKEIRVESITAAK